MRGFEIISRAIIDSTASVGNLMRWRLWEACGIERGGSETKSAQIVGFPPTVLHLPGPWPQPAGERMLVSAVALLAFFADPRTRGIGNALQTQSMATATIPRNASIADTVPSSSAGYSLPLLPSGFIRW
ncbi:hypothetical protein BDW67DRAFT_107358 [Aspergillus spinulosporus]